jgi:hypothetical protein
MSAVVSRNWGATPSSPIAAAASTASAARAKREDRQILNFFAAPESGELTPIKDSEGDSEAGGYNKA